MILTSNSYEFGYILGVLRGDGWIEDRKVYRHSTYRICLSTKDREFANFFAKIINKWCKKKPKLSLRIRFHNHTTIYGNKFNSKSRQHLVRLSSKEVVKFIKQNSKIIYSNPSFNFKRGFCQGFIDSEGSMSLRGIYIFNKNKKLLKLVRSFLENLGVKYGKRHISLNNRISRVYALRIHSMRDIRVFYKKINFRIYRKSKALKKRIEYFKHKIPIIPWTKNEKSFIIYNLHLMDKEIAEKIKKVAAKSNYTVGIKVYNDTASFFEMTNYLTDEGLVDIKPYFSKDSDVRIKIKSDAMYNIYSKRWVIDMNIPEPADQQFKRIFLGGIGTIIDILRAGISGDISVEPFWNADKLRESLGKTVSFQTCTEEFFKKAEQNKTTEREFSKCFDVLK